MTGGDAGPTVWPVPVWSGVWLECLDGASPVCVVPRLFEQARWCTRTSPVLVIPAKAGNQFGPPSAARGRIPASAGMKGGYEGTSLSAQRVSFVTCLARFDGARPSCVVHRQFD